MIAEISISKKRKDDKVGDSIKLSTQGIKLHISVYKFIDKDTKQNVLYAPSLELSAYGETIAKAHEMMKQSMNDYCEYLMNLPASERVKELQGLGWIKNKFFNKQFSRAYIDADGNLKDFNAEINTIERLTLEAA
jgi:hypothetical protein